MLVVCWDIHVLGSPLMSAEATRMQDLASQTLVSLNFSAVVAPLGRSQDYLSIQTRRYSYHIWTPRQLIWLE